ncbi:MAG: lipopolysaccharide kinase InaA family protein [Flavobacteriaceae bacterium]|nr:lipopolysaccharide kinase InaA family protein [Flavobacteriaceae bacterium]
MKKVLHKNFSDLEPELDEIVKNFDKPGVIFDYEKRNKMRAVKVGDLNINVKSFKIPNIVNQIAYKFFRKSKAERSYSYANTLLEKGVNTPQPIAYYEFFSSYGIKNSYYFSEQIDFDIMYRTLVADPEYPDHEKILRQFTRFTYKMHEAGIYFKDHSPGNTLIKKIGDNYDFYLVDLNRMKFFDLDFNARVTNFSRLTPKEDMVAVMSDEYAQLIDQPYEKVFKKMWKETEAFQYRFFRKKRWKKRLLGKPITVD